MPASQLDDLQLAEFMDRAQRVSSDMVPFGKTVMFDFGDLGRVFVNATVSPVTFEHAARFEQRADCRVKTKISTLKKLVDGSLDPMMAVFSGRLKISGEMDAALELAKRLKAANA